MFGRSSLVAEKSTIETQRDDKTLRRAGVCLFFLVFLQGYWRAFFPGLSRLSRLLRPSYVFFGGLGSVPPPAASAREKNFVHGPSRWWAVKIEQPDSLT